MANASFTRDEVILTLDVLYMAGDGTLTKSSPIITDLCLLLQTLPIHPSEKRPPNFRNTVGVSDQIRSFRSQIDGGAERSRWGVGKLFFEVANEFKDRHEELHDIAEAIRRNRDYFQSCTFGQSEEIAGFPEGALLSHLHRIIEVRDSEKLEKGSRCAICKIGIEGTYQRCNNFLEAHLLTPLTELSFATTYSQSNFVMVCPNCHAALHRFRPWRTRENIEEILK